MADVFTLQGSVDVDINKAIADVKRLGGEADTTSNKFAKMGEKLSNIGGKISNFGKNLTLGITVPIATAGAGAFKLASDMSESLNKVNVAFKGNAKEVTDWSKTTLKQFGLSQGSALEMVSLFGDMASGMDINSAEASKMSTSLVGLAADLSSYKNVSADMAQNALKGIFTGEGESLKSLGIIMTQSTLDQYALAKGIGKKTSQMTQSELVMLRYQYVMDKTKDAQGDFARTSDGASNQMRIFKESIKELGATIGKNLLPLITPIITKVNEWVQKFGTLDERTQKVILAVAGIVAAIGPVIFIGGKLVALCGAISTSMAAVTTATGLATAPILAIVGAIGLLVAGFIELWNTNEEFKYSIINGFETMKQALLPAFQLIKDNMDNIIGALSLLWETFVDLLNELWYAVLEPVWDGFVNAISGLGEIFQAVFPVLVFLFEAFAVGCKVIFETVLKPVFSWIGGLVKDVMKVFNGLVDFIVGIFTGNWKRAWNGVVNIFDGVFSTLESIAKAPLNGIIWLVNKVIGGLNSLSIDVPDWVPFVGGKSFGVNIPKIGYLENGGILTQPTMLNPTFMAGERNKGQENQAEAVVPLDKLIGWIEQIANRPVSISIDGKEFMRATAPYQNEYNNYNNLRFV